MNRNDSAAIVRPLMLGRGATRAVVKDNFAIAGLPTSMGSARFARVPPANANAVVVDRLVSEGIAITGRAAMHELAYGVTGRNDWSGTPLNPRWTDRIVGGSSSGCAAAVASGLVDIGIGTDTGGSIRLPAACCGIVGLKPGFGLIDHQGVSPANSTLDCVGPMARDVAGVVQAMAAMVDGFDADHPIDRPRVGILACQADAPVQQAFDAAIGRLDPAPQPVSLTLFDQAFEAGLTIIAAEMWSEFSWLAPEFEGIGTDVADRLRRAAQIDPASLTQAREIKRAFTAEMDALFAQYDFLVLPTIDSVPPLCAQADDPLQQLRLTRLVRPFNVSGHPAITLPTLTRDGLPVGIQIVSAMGRDGPLCAFARQVEAKIENSKEIA